MELKPGARLKSAVCDAEVVVVRPPANPISLECGGHVMTPHAEAKPEGLSLSGDYADGSQLGKRYGDAESGLEVLCVKAGAGALAVDGRKLNTKEAKRLPSSD